MVSPSAVGCRLVNESAALRVALFVYKQEGRANIVVVWENEHSTYSAGGGGVGVQKR